MNCPHCESDNHQVVDVKKHDWYIRRRRECLNCGRRFWTYEAMRLEKEKK